MLQVMGKFITKLSAPGRRRRYHMTYLNRGRGSCDDAVPCSNVFCTHISKDNNDLIIDYVMACPCHVILCSHKKKSEVVVYELVMGKTRHVSQSNKEPAVNLFV